MQAACAASLRTSLLPLATQPGAEAAHRSQTTCRLCPAPPARRGNLVAAAPGSRCRRHYRHSPPAPAASGSSDAGGAEPGEDHTAAALEKLAALADLNQLQTALNTAVAAEDWALAAKLRDLLRLLTGAEEGGNRKLASDWKGLGVLPWLADRAENLGFAFPTGARHAANGRGAGVGAVRAA